MLRRTIPDKHMWWSYINMHTVINWNTLWKYIPVMNVFFFYYHLHTPCWIIVIHVDTCIFIQYATKHSTHIFSVIQFFKCTYIEVNTLPDWYKLTIHFNIKCTLNCTSMPSMMISWPLWHIGAMSLLLLILYIYSYCTFSLWAAVCHLQ